MSPPPAAFFQQLQRAVGARPFEAAAIMGAAGLVVFGGTLIDGMWSLRNQGVSESARPPGAPRCAEMPCASRCKEGAARSAGMLHTHTSNLTTPD